MAAKMGAGATCAHFRDMGLSEQDVVRLMMPLYYTRATLTEEELKAATHAWKMITNDVSPYFNSMKQSRAPQPYDTCLEYFFYIFYTRLFDVHPAAKPLFQRHINKQGTFFVRFLSMSLEQIRNEEAWTKMFRNLAEIHTKLGVRAMEYGLFGEVLLYAIRMCIGSDSYTEAVHHGWCKIYSKMLDAIIPLVVTFELDHEEMVNAAQEKRFKTMSAFEASIQHVPVLTTRNSSFSSLHSGHGSFHNDNGPYPVIVGDINHHISERDECT